MMTGWNWDAALAGASLALMGAVLAALRNLPGSIWVRIKEQCSVSVDVLGGDQAFEWLCLWLVNHEYTRRHSRRLTASVSGFDGVRSGVVIFTPAPGAHFLRYRSHWLWITRCREDINMPGKDGSLWREMFIIRVLGREVDVARTLLEEARQVWLRPVDGLLSVKCVGSYGCWVEADRVAPRAPESVILSDPELMRGLIADLQHFEASRDWYVARGIPYRRGYLFHGAPGSGKSSTIKAMAGASGRAIYLLSLSGKEMDDGRLNGLMSQVPAHAIVVLEDADAAFEQREGHHGVTFSGLLNAIDGIAAREGQVFVLTTNHIDRLDPALIRPGRIDRRVEFAPATRGQIAALFQLFHPEADDGAASAFVASCPPEISMAEVQARLIGLRLGTPPSARLERAA